MAKFPTRERLIDAATRLFASDGYHAVGISRILAEAGVSRVALYHHFRSKEELILAVLRHRDEVTRNLIMRGSRRLALAAGTAAGALEFLDRYVGQPDFSGCMFLNAAAEYHDDDDPIHRVSASTRRCCWP